MIISEWSLSFETGALPEGRLRVIANEMFQGSVGRGYWESVRETRLATSAGRRERRFHEILNEEYDRATPSASSSTTARACAGKSMLTKRERLLWAAAGAFVVWFFRSIRSSKAATAGVSEPRREPGRSVRASSRASPTRR